MKRFNVQLPIAYHQALRQLAHEENKSMSEVIRESLVDNKKFKFWLDKVRIANEN